MSVSIQLWYLEDVSFWFWKHLLCFIIHNLSGPDIMLSCNRTRRFSISRSAVWIETVFTLVYNQISSTGVNLRSCLKNSQRCNSRDNTVVGHEAVCLIDEWGKKWINDVELFETLNIFKWFVWSETVLKTWLNVQSSCFLHSVSPSQWDIC